VLCGSPHDPMWKLTDETRIIVQWNLHIWKKDFIHSSPDNQILFGNWFFKQYFSVIFVVYALNSPGLFSEGKCICVVCWKHVPRNKTKSCIQQILFDRLNSRLSSLRLRAVCRSQFPNYFVNMTYCERWRHWWF